MSTTGSMSVAEIAAVARQIRLDVLDMIYRAGSGHLGGSLSCAEILATLYFGHMRLGSQPGAPADACSPDRDRFLLSKGHAAPALYSVLSLKGYIPREELASLRQLNSRLQGHPDCKKCPGVDIGAGPLGHGVSVGVGMALAGRLDGRDYRVYVLLGDGELQAGVIWEGAMAAAKFGLDHLIAIVDNDEVQLDGFVRDIMPIEPLRDKWAAFGWNVIECDGHSVPDLLVALGAATAGRGQPTVIIAHTVKGKGVSFMEHKSVWHGRVPTPAEYEQARAELEG
jgi:transketolase